MARPVEQAGPVSLLEDAAHLLRRAPLGDLLCHWIGSAPLAVFLLAFWHDATHPPVSDAAVAGKALAAALLLIWMACWRSAFSDRLMRHLSGAAERPWDRRRIWRLAASQAFLSGTKLLLLPLSLVAVFPFAATVGFYRNATVLAGRGDLDPLAVLRKARRLEKGDVFQSWLLQMLLLLLSLVTMLNVAVTFIVLPQLFRMLTGYESAFTRSGSNFYENRLFLLVVLAATWLVFDPFVQAVYCLRCFGRESVETGEDLRSGLRRIRLAAGILLALAAFAQTGRAADAVSPGELERAVRQTMQAPEYNWRIPPPESAGGSTPWIVTATERAIRAVRSAVQWAGKMIDRVLRWIFGGPALSPMPVGGQTPGAALHWSVWAMIAVAAGLAGWALSRALAGRKRGSTPGPAPAPVRLEDDTLTADRLPEDAWLAMAERCLAEGNVRLALRAFYLANLAWLGREGLLTIQAGRTNRDFERELLRRARQSPEARELFSANVRSFERAWYGMHEVAGKDAIEFRRRGEEIKARLRSQVAA
jgi:hypothetical protein